MKNWASESEAREQIKELVTEYYHDFKEKKEPYKEGDRITYAARVLSLIHIFAKGETVGLIGKNGCGKSTTLKLLTKILRPNGGSIDIQGRVCSLIELGAGFHPDMSGRENIYINAVSYTHLIIPAYNEADNIGRVVENLIRNFPQYDYVIVNDGSSDGTGELCMEKGYQVLNLPINLGIGGAVQTGYRYALK